MGYRRLGCAITGAAVLLCVVLCCAAPAAETGGPEENGTSRERDLATKQHFGFAEWAGKTEIPKDTIARLSFTDEALKALGNVTISTAAPERGKVLAFSIEPSTETSGATVDITLFDTVLQAHENLIGYFRYVSAPLTLFERMEKKPPVVAGDVCIVYKPTWHLPGVHDKPVYASVMFARDNVLVRIQHDGLAEGKRALNLMEIARKIDVQLVLMGRYGRLTASPDDVEGLTVERVRRREWAGAEAAGLPETHYVLHQTFRVGEVDGWVTVSVFDDNATAERAAQAWMKNVAAMFEEGLWEGARPARVGDRCWYGDGPIFIGLLVQAGDVSFLVSVRAAEVGTRREVALALAKAISKRAAQGKEPEDSLTEPAGSTPSS